MSFIIVNNRMQPGGTQFVNRWTDANTTNYTIDNLLTVRGSSDLGDSRTTATAADSGIATMAFDSATITGMSGATVSATNLIPAGSVVLGVTVRVRTAITGATSFDIGDGVDIDAWGAAIDISKDTSTSGQDFTITTLPIYASATDVVLTANVSNFTDGEVRITVHYLQFVAPSV